jgi:hypothetical protein
MHHLCLADAGQTLLPAPPILHLAGKLATGGVDIITPGFTGDSR